MREALRLMNSESTALVTRVLILAFLVSSSIALYQLSSAIVIYGKAWMSQHLLEYAWRESVASGQAARPWPWSDSKVVAKLTVMDSNLALPVLDGEQGSVLAFAPGLRWLDNGNESRIPLVQGHRDTHMQFMKTLKTGDRLQFETPESKRIYVVSEAQVYDADNLELNIETADEYLILSTCYPFDSVEQGNQRLVVILTAV